MADVIDFPRGDDDESLIYVCRCGCRTHYMHRDGAAECASCGQIADEESGAWDDPPLEADAEIKGDLRDKRDFGDPDFSMRRFAERVAAGEFTHVVAMKENGGVACVGTVCETRAERGWLRRKLKEARRILVESAKCS